MSYVPGEKRVTKTVENRKRVEEVYNHLHKQGGRSVGGSMRFDSHGYIAGLENKPDPDQLQKTFPDVEFRHDGDKEYGYRVRYRTKGSTGWHPGG